MTKNTTQPPLKGVNLGGWLVLEKWMTPRLFAGFDASDEVGFVSLPGSHERLEQHRKTFITEGDIHWLADQGINAIRVPVGHWVFGDVKPYVGCVEYLDWAVEMAGKYKMKLIIDLHRTPGSADGHDNSIYNGAVRWYDAPELREQTLSVLERLAERYGQFEQVYGIEILNEPKVKVGRILLLRRFYQEAYKRMTPHMRPGMAVLFNDGFFPLLFNGTIRTNGIHPAVMDVHYYHFQVPFDGWRSLNGHIHKAKRRALMIWWLRLRQPVIIGEWSVVISGRRMSKVPKGERRDFKIRYAQAQQRGQRAAAGTFYWSYKTQERGAWHFRSLVEDGDLVVQ